MNQQFYIAVDGKQTGPFSYDDLKTKGLQRDALIWTEGLDNWTKAEHVALVKDILRAVPPPLPPQEKKESAPPPPPPISIPQPVGKYFGYELARRRERFFAVLVETMILLIPMLIILSITNPDHDSAYSLGNIVVGLIFSAILGALFYSMWSGNLGHKIMGLKVISAVDGADQNTALAGALRESLKNIFGYPILPVIWLLWDDDRQNLYDKVVKTYVVKKKQVQ